MHSTVKFWHKIILINHYTPSGDDQLSTKLDRIVKELESTDRTIDSSKCVKDFKIMTKYLAFAVCAARAPVKEKLLDETVHRVDKAGKSTNIQRWSNWTLDQMSVMSNIDNLPRVFLVGGNGVGKTVTLAHIAKNLAEKGEDVLFLIFNVSEMSDLGKLIVPLIEIQLENEFEKYKDRIKVLTFCDISQISDADLKCSNILIDEAHEMLLAPAMEKLCSLPAKRILIVFRGTQTEDGLFPMMETDHNPSKYLDENYSDWYLLQLNYPLRTSKTVSELMIKEHNSETLALQNVFNKNLTIPEHMPLGPTPIFVEEKDGRNFFERFDCLWNQIKPLVLNRSILFALDYILCSEEDIQLAWEGLGSDYWNDIDIEKYKDVRGIDYLICLLYALKMKGRAKPLLLPGIVIPLNDVEAIKKGLNGKYGQRDIIASHESIFGAEADIVVVFGHGDYAIPYFMSRCKAQFACLCDEVRPENSETALDN